MPLKSLIVDRDELPKMRAGLASPPAPPWVVGLPRTAHVARPKAPCRAGPQRGAGPGASIYVLKLPLIGMEGLGALPQPLYGPAALHEAVVVQATAAEDGPPWMYDFVPQDATNPATIASLLAGRAVPSQARTQQLRALPARRGGETCRLAGVTLCSYADALERAAAFQEGWRYGLQLFKRDCRDHTRELVAALLSEGRAG